MNIFAVGSKLLGVVLGYVGLFHVISAVGFAFAGFSVPGLAITALGAGIAFSFAYVLMFRTEWLAGVVGVGVGAGATESPTLTAVEPGALLRAGIILVGLYVFVTRVATWLRDISMYLGGGLSFQGVGPGYLRLLIELVPVALALLLVFRSDLVARAVVRGEEVT